MEIAHIGHTTLFSPARNLYLNNVLHVPKTSKNLLSIHQLTRDNNAFVEFHPTHYCVKEQQTKNTILRGGCECGLYPLPSCSRASSSNKEVHVAPKVSESLWHHRLGHASSPIVQQVLSHNKLSYSRDLSPSVCNACQQGKSHQLPYPKSSSLSSSPLDLIFFRCVGSRSCFCRQNTYYVSFIDDHSKFVWIYLLRKKIRGVPMLS
jgi:histone deacetylase 1/2